MELDDYTYSRIVAICEEGNNACHAGDFDRAIALFNEGLDMLPEPVEIWEAATWFFVGIGDAYFLSKRYKSALDTLLDAMHCPGAIGNPFVHLRLGQVQFELENYILATDELTRAYMGDGSKIFEGEDPKYFEFLKTQIREPLAGWDKY